MSYHKVLNNEGAVIALSKQRLFYDFLHEVSHRLTYKHSGLTPDQWRGLSEQTKEAKAFRFMRERYWNYLTKEERTQAIAYAAQKGVTLTGADLKSHLDPYPGNATGPTITISESGTIEAAFHKGGIMTEEQAVQLAVSFVKQSGLRVHTPHESVRRVSSEILNKVYGYVRFANDFWVVEFPKVLGPGVAFEDPGTIMIVVDDRTGAVSEGPL